MMDDSKLYRESLEKGFVAYWDRKKKFGEFTDDLLDSKYVSARFPVFKIEWAERNIITKPDATEEEKKRLLSLIPTRKRHRWFRSMNSSQALALSFFGNLIVYGQMDWLGDLKDNNNDALFGTADLSTYNFSLEHEIGILNEPRPTSLDVFISGRYRVAIECKLTESEVGSCSRPRLKRDSQEYCDGSYSFQKGRSNRCALTEIGIRYWDYVPKLFKLSAETSHDECPLKDDYQLVRNILAACVREDGIVSPRNGHTVLVYDNRNPAFADGVKGADSFRKTYDALQNPQNLKKISWQKICSFMKQNNQLNWLANAISDKYGIE